MPPRSASPLLLPVLALTTTVIAVLQTVVVPVLATIGLALGSSPSATGWVLTANLLAAAVLTPVLGRLGDVHGRRPVLLAVLVVVTAGSLLAALTTSLPMLLLARVLQGASYALFPLSMGVLRDELPGERLTGAMAIVSAALGAGGGFGLVLTGLLARDGGDYHRVFWAAAAVSLLALLLAARVVPARTPPASGGVDWLGAAVLGAGLVLLLLPLSRGAAWGWRSPATVGCLLAAATVLALWWVLQNRLATPLSGRRCCAADRSPSRTPPRCSSAWACSWRSSRSPASCRPRRPPGTGSPRACSPPAPATCCPGRCSGCCSLRSAVARSPAPGAGRCCCPPPPSAPAASP